MAVGLMMLPAAASRFWANEVWTMALVAIAVGFLSGFLGLVASYRFGLPSGPAIVLAASLFYVASILVGRRNGLVRQHWPARHLAT